jgi:hypothetical protein
LARLFAQRHLGELLMLALIRTLGPVIALLTGMGGGGLLVGGLGAAYNIFIDNPHVRELERVRQEDACTIRTQAAAAVAEKAERLRQQAAGNAALEAYRDAVEARERMRIEVVDQLEREIAENEARLAEQGRSCLTDDADVRWLLER